MSQIFCENAKIQSKISQKTLIFYDEQSMFKLNFVKFLFGTAGYENEQECAISIISGNVNQAKAEINEVCIEHIVLQRFMIVKI